MDNLENNGVIPKIQSVKILPALIHPTLEETLISMGLDVRLEYNLRFWLNQLKETWRSWKRCATVEQHIDALYRSRPDSFKLALLFVINCEEIKDCKPKTLPYFLIEILLKYSESFKVNPDEELKLPAFHIAIHQRNQNFLSLIVKVYQLSTVKSQILSLVKEMISTDNRKLASQVIIAMELFDDIPVQDILFPLLLQDKGKLIDDYLSVCPSQAKPFVLFMDSLLNKNIKLLDYVQSYAETNKISQIQSDKLHYKPLGKIVARLCHKYNIPIETCHYLCLNRTTSGLKYMVYKRYVDNDCSCSEWDDLIKDSLKQHKGSGHEFINLLVDYDKKEALKWAQYLNLPENEYPLCLRQPIVEDNEPEEENWDTDVKEDAIQYYKSSLTMEQIIIIDSGEKFYDLMTSVLNNKSIVSLDCEWKPSFGTKQSQVALIQLGTDENVFLIDTILLNQQEYASFWHTFLKSFLDNAEIIKLGFGLEQDLREMKTIVSLGNLKVRGEGLLDLSLVWKSLIKHGLLLPGSSDCGGSLSSLVQSCFGLPLEKSEQCSNWELRPLRETQIKYAALDAYVLIKIYNFLQNKCFEQEMNFEEICNDVMIESKKKAVKKPKVIERTHQLFPVFESRPVSKVKFLVESPIINLMPYLRYCGIDTVAIPATKLWHDVVYRAISEDCFILLTKQKNTPNANFPQSSILCPGKGSVTEQLHKIINTFSLEIQPSDLLTICIYCNGKSLKKLPVDEVSNICQSYSRALSSTAACTKYVPDYHDDDTPDFGNFLSDSECEDELEICHARVGTDNHKPPVTSKGIQIVIDDLGKLLNSPEPTLLCEDCGKLYALDDILLKTVRDTVNKVTKITHPT